VLCRPDALHTFNFVLVFSEEAFMGLLDDIANKAAGDSANPLASHLMEMIHSQPGGLSGLLQNFHDKGLGELVTSWVGTGQNLPISADQIQQVLGSEQVQQLAAKCGISSGAVSAQLAHLFPTVVDKLTPNGEMPTPSSLLETGMTLLKSLSKTATDAA
jgi:uncharacterized protein YidB (DUF937 family)